MLPRWLVRFLERALPPDDAEPWVGDLEELHRRRLGRHGRLGALLLSLADATWLLLRWTPVRLGAALADGLRGVSASELRLALRLVRKQPVATLTSVVALGVGIGIVAGGFSVFHQAFSSDLGWPDSDRWVTVASRDAETRASSPMTREHLRLARASVPALAYLGGARSEELNLLLGEDGIERVEGARLTPGLFAHLPYTPVAGRLLVAADGGPGAEGVALLRESLWERRFQRSPEVLGRTVTVSGEVVRVVGVLPDDAGFPSGGELWLALPEEGMGATAQGDAVGSRLVGVLAPGVTVETARAQLQAVADRVAEPGRGAPALALEVARLGEVGMGPGIQLGVALFMAMLLGVLLVIGANVGNLVVARTSRRAPELAVRTALGASRARIVGQIFGEMLLVGALAAVPGLALAGAILELYDGLLDELPFWVELSLRPSTAVVVAVLAVLVAAVTGVLPALRATGRAPGDALKGAGRGASLSVSRWGGLMMAVEVALCVALLGSATLYAQGYQRYLDPAFDLPEERVLTARLTLVPPEGWEPGTPDPRADRLEALRRAVGELPGVEAVAFASHLPRLSPWPEPVEVEGRAEVEGAPLVHVGPDFFQVLEVEPVEGRVFGEEDLAPDALPVAVVNRAFALERWGTERVVGRRLRLSGSDGAPEHGAGQPWRQVVGVVPDVVEVATGTRDAGVYVPLVPRRYLSLAARTSGDALALVGPLRRVAYDVDPELDLREVVRLDQVGAENRQAMAVMSAGLTAIGLVTLLLSLAGVYSLVSLSVTQRTREIGVRVALGAEPRRILGQLLRRSGLLVGGGALAGAGLGWWLSSLDLFVFVVPRGGWWLFPSLVVLMAAAGAAACWVPARRALSIQPVEALQREG